MKAAEADAEAKYLSGQGVARQRQVGPAGGGGVVCGHCQAVAAPRTHDVREDRGSSPRPASAPRYPCFSAALGSQPALICPQAIIAGLRESVQMFSQEVNDVNSRDVMELLVGVQPCNQSVGQPNRWLLNGLVKKTASCGAAAAPRDRCQCLGGNWWPCLSCRRGGAGAGPARAARLLHDWGCHVGRLPWTPPAADTAHLLCPAPSSPRPQMITQYMASGGSEGACSCTSESRQRKGVLELPGGVA